MTESAVHRSMKAIVKGELEMDRFVVLEEPQLPPGHRMFWSAYRPDLIAYRPERGEEEVVLVECETRPNMRRLEAKNLSSVWFQPSIYEEGVVTKILAVPRGKLGSVDMDIRRGWQVWVLGSSSCMAKLSILPASPGE